MIESVACPLNSEYKIESDSESEIDSDVDYKVSTRFGNILIDRDYKKQYTQLELFDSYNNKIHEISIPKILNQAYIKKIECDIKEKFYDKDVILIKIINGIDGIDINNKEKYYCEIKLYLRKIIKFINMSGEPIFSDEEEIKYEIDSSCQNIYDVKCHKLLKKFLEKKLKKNIGMLSFILHSEKNTVFCQIVFDENNVNKINVVYCPELEEEKEFIQKECN